ncbi:hypothetical protein [Mycobacterium gordonae]|uniref:hypothetical protein n=1 Tax=Mycobacterium gordonae TaxID=1778 RepID=UPI001E3609FB|nr:hypothetical protein [Mycobacterium gordonae]MCQ4365295.1 hypothetical protein [Mycobacterium gordonae]
MAIPAVVRDAQRRPAPHGQRLQRADDDHPHSRDGVLAGEFGLEVGGHVHRQPFEFRLLPTAQLLDELHDAGLRLETPEPETTEWLRAVLR